MKITDNTPMVLNFINVRASLFLRNAMDEAERISDPKTPKNRGNLRRDKIKQVLGLHGKMLWGKDYAVYQEVKQFRNYTTPGTGPHFAENAMRQLPARTQKIAKMSGLA